MGDRRKTHESVHLPDPTSGEATQVSSKKHQRSESDERLRPGHRYGPSCWGVVAVLDLSDAVVSKLRLLDLAVDANGVVSVQGVHGFSANQHHPLSGDPRVDAHLERDSSSVGYTGLVENVHSHKLCPISGFRVRSSPTVTIVECSATDRRAEISQQPQPIHPTEHVSELFARMAQI